MQSGYYNLLEVPPNATQAQIKESYRRLAMLHHPDKNPGNQDAEEHFKKINEAYKTLSDPVRRNWYDILQGSDSFLASEPKRAEQHKKYGTSKRTRKTKEESDADTIRQYDQWVAERSFFLRAIVPFTFMLWGLQLVFSNWFINENGDDTVKIAGGILMFLIATYFFTNVWFVKLQMLNAKKLFHYAADRFSMLLFILTLLLCSIGVVYLNNVRLQYHYDHYMVPIDAIVSEAKNVYTNSDLSVEQEVTYQFRVNGNTIAKTEKVVTPHPLRRNDIIAVEFSKAEPRISRILKPARMPGI